MLWNIHYIIPRSGSRWFPYRLLATELIGDQISTDHSKLSVFVSSPSSSPVPDPGRFPESFFRRSEKLVLESFRILCELTNDGPFAGGVLRDPVAILGVQRIGIWNITLAAHFWWLYMQSRHDLGQARGY